MPQHNACMRDSVCMCVWASNVEACEWQNRIDKRRLTGAENQWGLRERTFSQWWSQTPWRQGWWSPPQPPQQWWWRGSVHWIQLQLVTWTKKNSVSTVRLQIMKDYLTTTTLKSDRGRVSNSPPLLHPFFQCGREFLFLKHTYFTVSSLSAE